jgi:hypothetical protein
MVRLPVAGAYPPRALPIGFRIFAQESALLARRLLGANEPGASASLSVTDKLFLCRTYCHYTAHRRDSQQNNTRRLATILAAGSEPGQHRVQIKANARLNPTALERLTLDTNFGGTTITLHQSDSADVRQNPWLP